MTSSIHHTSPMPVHGALPSYWRKSVDTIDNHRSTETLPTRADIVIIGAGYAGASVLHHLIEENKRDERPLPSIVLLEAREACSGATGRNGGHLKPDPIARAARVLETHGPDVAEHVASFEMRHVDEIKELVEREGIVCDFEETTLTDVCLHIPTRERINNDIAKLLRANISSAKAIQYFPENEAEKASGVKGAVSCHKYHAARLWPYKLVSHLLAKAVSYGVNLQTHTPVISVSEAERGSGDHRWLVDTPRGSISTDNVVYATNAYTSALIPEMKDKIVPVRGIVARLVGENVPPMSNSYMMRISEYEYDYMIPRPDGSIVVGGAKRDFYKNLHEWFNNSDDSKLIDGAKTYFDGYMQRHFLGWEDSNTQTEDLWTGIMGYSNDGFPYVGPACGRPGQYVCAGFTGHGMPQIFLSAKAIAEMLVTGDANNVDLPIPYRISSSRWSQSKEHDSLKMWQEVANGDHVHARL